MCARQETARAEDHAGAVLGLQHNALAKSLQAQQFRAQLEDAKERLGIARGNCERAQQETLEARDSLGETL